MRRWRPPLPANVELQDRLPSFLWAGNLRSEIRNASGPWHSSGDWWETDRQWSREEWDVELATDGVYRLARITGQGWFVEGEYD